MAEYNDAMMRNRDAAVQARTKAQNRANILQLKLVIYRDRKRSVLVFLILISSSKP